MMPLYKITHEYQCLFNELEKKDELDESDLAAIHSINGMVESKAIALSSYIKNLDAEKNAIDEAIKQMNDRSFAIEKKVSSLEKYLHDNMVACNVSEISCPYFKIKIKKCPTSVGITNQELIPEEFKNKKEVISIDRMRIKDALKEGLNIPGAALVQNTRVEIK